MKTGTQQTRSRQEVYTNAQKQNSMRGILQTYKNKIAQRMGPDEEELLQRQPNNTGLPDNLKSGIENLSGYSMNDVKVHYNSSQPATLQAHAYAQGTDIHVAPGQEKHLPHEAWHVVQQKQGRVKATRQMKGKVNINDDAGLEKEADVMGAKAQNSSLTSVQRKLKNSSGVPMIQKYSETKRFKTSENDHYRVDKSGKDEIGVKDGTAVPSPANLMTNTGNTWYGFKRYQYTGQYENDCLQFAQHLARTIANLNNGEMFKVTIAGMPMDFAVNNSHTQAADDNFGPNETTNPSIGEAYSTVPKTGAVLTGCSFHIATVVAKDGGDNITCEADAGDVGRMAPVFDMYNTNISSNATFHATYKAAYGGDLAVTGKLSL